MPTTDPRVKQALSWLEKHGTRKGRAARSLAGEIYGVMTV